MEYMKNTLEFHMDGPSVITLGKFDGRHRGHELLMEHLLLAAREEHLKTVVFTFDIPPQSRTGDGFSKVLTTNEEKRYIFGQEGIDCLIECPFTREVMCMEPEAFVAWICEALHVKKIIVGEDFRFGHNRSGNPEVLRHFEEKYGYKTVVLEKMKEDNRDISSTFVREEIAAGNIKKANRLLGYPYFIYSRVVHGSRIGRKLGFPTVNMVLPEEKLLPKNGVYVTQTHVKGNEYKSITNVGCKPTVSDERKLGVETFIFGFDGELYDEIIKVSFLDYLREERQFASLEELQRQIALDIENSRDFPN